jgi:hypothetical protein
MSEQIYTSLFNFIHNHNALCNSIHAISTKTKQPVYQLCFYPTYIYYHIRILHKFRSHIFRRSSRVDLIHLKPLTYEKCTTQLKTKSANDKMSLPSRNQMTRTNKHHFNTETHRKQERATYFPKWIPEPMVLLAIIISDPPKNFKN